MATLLALPLAMKREIFLASAKITEARGLLRGLALASLPKGGFEGGRSCPHRPALFAPGGPARGAMPRVFLLCHVFTSLR